MFKKILLVLIEKDNEAYSESLSNKYDKKFIYSYYIYKDDTIKNLKIRYVVV